MKTTPATPKHQHGLMWFRRDLRLSDNAALYHALKHCENVHCVFVFDQHILDALENKSDRRVEFIVDAVNALQTSLQAFGSDLHIYHDVPEHIIPKLVKQFNITNIYTNQDDEPYALQRDQDIQEILAKEGIKLHRFKDHMIFARNEVLKQDGKPYTVFTPYKNAWLKRINHFYLSSYPCELYYDNLAKIQIQKNKSITLDDLGFTSTNLKQLNIIGSEASAENLFNEFLSRITRYHQTRDYPSIKGVSYLSVHLRFGTISIRRLARLAYEMTLHTSSPNTSEAVQGAQTWLNELIWRDFYFQILYHFPHAVQSSFKPEYDQIQWDNSPMLWQAWCEGKTGYPIVDAAMRQLNQTGYMHNRLRMIVASFLTKDLGIDWRWGEAYFAKHLNDFDLAANNGGWQWAASTGCDAQPYFRIFNPITQSEKFDAQGKFIRRYVPEIVKLSDKYIHAPWQAPSLILQDANITLGTTYPMPIIEHSAARQRTLERYGILKKN